MRGARRAGWYFVILALVLLTGARVFADGGFFSRLTVKTVAVSADQRAIIVRLGDLTSLLLSTGYTGAGEDLAWIIPTPVPPAIGDVREASDVEERGFAILDTITAVREVATGEEIAGVRQSMSSKGSAPLVTVHGKVTTVHYEVSILSAEGSSALVDWLVGNAYRVDETARSVLAEYVARRWSFVAVKLRPSVARVYTNEFLPPLSIRYASDQFVFPLRISTVSTTTRARITLYVVAPGPVTSSNYRTVPLRLAERRSAQTPEEYVEDSIRRSLGPAEHGLVVMWSGRYDGSTYTIAQATLEDQRESSAIWIDDFGDEFYNSLEVFGRALYLTRLEGVFEPSTMTDDIRLGP